GRGASSPAGAGGTRARLPPRQTGVEALPGPSAPAARGRRPVVLALPLDVQAGSCDGPGLAAGPPAVPGTIAASVTGAAAIAGGAPPAETVEQLAAALARAQRPVFIAGRGARHGAAAPALARLAAGCGALLATSAAAKG